MMEIKKSKETVDSWYGVHDPRKRKRIQDRLAQRARRKRLLAAQNSEQTSATQSSIKNPQAAIIQQLPRETAMVCAHPPASASSTSFSAPGATHPTPLLPSSVVPLTPFLSNDHQLLPDQKLRIIGALRINGSILGISCNGAGVVKSARPPTVVPDFLHPTPLQLTTPHHLWIDGWPFPRMRDNMIILHQIINIEEFFSDFHKMETFMIKDASAPWDPHAWYIAPGFAAKWGYLFH